jgi:hypothetical protein
MLIKNCLAFWTNKLTLILLRNCNWPNMIACNPLIFLKVFFLKILSCKIHSEKKCNRKKVGYHKMGISVCYGLIIFRSWFFGDWEIMSCNFVFFRWCKTTKTSKKFNFFLIIINKKQKNYFQNNVFESNFLLSFNTSKFQVFINKIPRKKSK